MKIHIMNLIRKIHHSIPPEIRRSYRFVVVIANRISEYILPVYHCACRNEETGEDLSIVQIGWDKKILHYWLSRFSEQQNEIERLRWITVWRIHRYLVRRKNKFELAIVDSSSKSLVMKFSMGFMVPRWIELVLNIEQVSKKKKFHNIRRNITKQSMTFEVRYSMEDFDLFYHHMYAPFVRDRHGAQADVADYKHFSSKFRREKAALFFIIWNDKPVAAAYVEEKGDISRLSAVGVLEGNQDIYRMGVVGALYYQVILHYREQGMKSLLLGKSMAVLFDGVTEFKRQFGAVPYLKDLSKQGSYHIIPVKATPASIGFMKRNPVFYFQDDALCIAGFVDRDDFADKSEFLRHFKRFYPAQVEKTTLYCFGDSQQIKEWLLEEGMEQIQLENAGNAFPD
jgi:hypothetical protein